MEILEICQLPTPKSDEPQYDESTINEIQVHKCHVCDETLDSNFFEYSQGDIYSLFVCEKCQHTKNLGICFYDFKLYPKDQLVQLTSTITIHKSQGDVITTYTKISHNLRGQYLDGVGIMDQPVTCYLIGPEANLELEESGLGDSAGD